MGGPICSCATDICAPGIPFTTLRIESIRHCGNSLFFILNKVNLNTAKAVWLSPLLGSLCLQPHLRSRLCNMAHLARLITNTSYLFSSTRNRVSKIYVCADRHFQVHIYVRITLREEDPGVSGLKESTDTISTIYAQ